MESTVISGSETTKNSTKPRLRSVAYPSSTIQNCVKFVERIDKEFTSVIYTPKEAISKNLNVSGGAFLMQLSSCVQYDLLDLKQGEGYKPTERFKKIIKPLPNENVNDFLIECFQSPELYKKLITQFRDQELPSDSGLANILDRNYQIKGNATNIAAKVFLKNVAALGLIGPGNIFKLESYLPFEEEADDVVVDNNPKVDKSPLLITMASSNPSVSKEPNLTQTKEIPVFLQGVEREAKVVLPVDFTEDDLRRILKVINAYLP